MEKNKEPALRILDLKNRFTFKERLIIEISGLKERLNFFSNFETFETSFTCTYRSRSRLSAAIGLRAEFEKTFITSKFKSMYCDLWRKSPDFS